MSFRQRYLETLLFKRPAKIPLMPGCPRESTLKAWHAQGLPGDKPWDVALFEELGLPYEAANIRSPGVSFVMIPTFEEKVLEHRNGHYLVQDWMGAITEISDEFDYTYIRSARDFVTRKWHKFPVENRKDFEDMRCRYDPDSPARFPENFEDRCKQIRQSGALVYGAINGPFWQLREWMGFENLCLKFIEEPDFVQEMIDIWSEFVSQLLVRIHRHISFDYVIISEDMAYKAHSMISPQMTRRFLLLVYQRWVAQLKQAGCQLVGIDSDGCIEELIPIWIETGVNLCTPVEVAAHNDIVDFRNRFGEAIAYTGGIDKRAMAAGGDVIKREIDRIAPVAALGGYIPGCDHGVPSDVSWPNFIEYSRLLALICGWY